MATATKVYLPEKSGDDAGYFRDGTTEEQARLTSQFLQENHDQNHIFSDGRGMRLHNHIAHHLLAIYALNASPELLRKGYERNVPKQHQQSPVKTEILHELHDPVKFVSHLGPPENYEVFLAFFAKEIDQYGWQNVLQQYLFSGSEQAEALFVRMYAGFLHPIIHLGYGVEFGQPAIVAEALAQAASHEDWIGQLLLPAEREAQEQKKISQPKNIVQLLDEMQQDEKLVNAPHWEDGNKIRDGVIARAGEEMVRYASQFYLHSADELDEKTAEMTNAVCYYTAASQHPPQMVLFDFYFMHCVNASIFFSVFNDQKWLSKVNKVRLLEWKVRLDLTMYASRKCPKLRFDEIRDYKPRQLKNTGWDGVQDRACIFPDDGHAAKLVRALAHGQRICKPYEADDAFRVKHDDWLQIGHMAIDSVENTERFDDVGRWVRSAGFDKAWENKPLREQL